MAGKKPLVLYGADIKELASTDTITLVNGVTGESVVSGWIALDTCTYEIADSPTFQFSIASDVTGFIGVGNRIKLTQTTVKYFLVTAVGAYSGGKTIITVYGGTDYTLDSAAITLPYFSIHKAPFGFPLDPIKWTVRLSDANTRTQSSPTQNTIYNLGSLSLEMPIGAWCVNVQLCPFFTSTGSQVGANIEFGLSTSTSSFSDTDLNGFSYQGGASSTQAQINNFYRSKIISVTSKTTHYLVARTTLTTIANINFLGANSPSIVEFRSAYL